MVKSAIALEADKNAITIRQAKAKLKFMNAYLLKDNVDGQDSAPYNAKDYLDQIGLGIPQISIVTLCLKLTKFIFLKVNVLHYQHY